MIAVLTPDCGCTRACLLAPAGDTTVSNDRSSQPSAAASSYLQPPALQPQHPHMLHPAAAGFPLPLPLLAGMPPWQALAGQPAAAFPCGVPVPGDSAAGAGSHVPPNHAPAPAAAGLATVPAFAGSFVMGEWRRSPAYPQPVACWGRQAGVRRALCREGVLHWEFGIRG